MSSESPRRGGYHKGVQIISPQPINDRSIIDSVAGIINDIVPQAYATGPNLDNKESITWARFEYADLNDTSLYLDYIEESSTSPLLLVLGYTSGVQVWLVAASGEATEILSWRQSIVRILRILPNPIITEKLPDPYNDKRPLIAICDSTGPGPQFCSVNFISLKTGEQTKSIKFKNQVCDVLANRRSIVVTFSEKIAVFDARTFEDVLTVTSCYPCPGPNPNPVALGTRWLAYSEKKLLPTRRSSGGCEGEGVPSYTAAVLYAAKSLSKGLRGLGESVASSLTGNTQAPIAINTASDITQPGVITILDLQASKQGKQFDDTMIETVVAHFTAHSDVIVAMTFDLTGAILMTADKRGHDFHIFRIQPHPGGPSLAAVHHLYVLHRGDTTAKVQDMVFSCDTRWAAVSTVRGTTHVFPIAPYGGSVGMRTHSTPHVVNRLSRFHRSAGLTDDSTRSHSPVSNVEIPHAVYPYSNPRLPPYPHPTVVHPLAQIRQPSSLNHNNNQLQSRPQQRQRLHSDDNGSLPLKLCACFAPSRAWTYMQRDSTIKMSKRAVDSLFIMACHGNMIQYDLEPKPTSGVPKEKVCDNTMIELEVEAKGQWPLLRMPNSIEILPPLHSSSPLLSFSQIAKNLKQPEDVEDRWLSQVEIVTHAGPHRRLWMGPQFVFKTYNAPSGVNLIESDAVEVGVSGSSRPARSNPVNMPHTATRPVVPVLTDGSGSSYEQSPRFMETYGDSLEGENIPMGNGDNQLREDLADAMLETSTVSNRIPGRRLVVERVGQPVTKVVNPLGTVITVLADEEDVSSSQEFDDGPEYVSEAPKSVCAEEGPASLGDFDSEGNLLRDLTEICAEMRTSNKLAFNNISYTGIKDVKEQKSFCVEAAIMNPDEHAIDFERADAFRDIPTSLSLCAEPGEIPHSPMTRARENDLEKKIEKNRKAEMQEKCFSHAEYVVNCEEDGVVLIENKTTIKGSTKDYSSEQDSKQSSKRPVKHAPTLATIKHVNATNMEHPPKYLLHEQDDSIVIEDTTMKVNDLVATAILSKASNTSNVKGEDIKHNEKAIPIKCYLKMEPIEATVATACGVASLPLDVTIFDEINCMDYHIIDPSIFHTKNSPQAHQSDDDIEHIQTSDDIVTLIDNDVGAVEPYTNTVIEDYDTPHTQQREGSKSTISDDDLEHIQTSELSELYDKARLHGTLKDEGIHRNEEESPLLHTRIDVSSNDDVEHLLHSDLTNVDQSISKPSPLSECITESLTISNVVEKKFSHTIQESKGCKIQTRTSRKRKDVLTIDRETQEDDEVLVIVKPHTPQEDNYNKSKSPEKDLIEEIDCCTDSKDWPSDLTISQNFPRKTRLRTAKISTSLFMQKTPSNLVEIIDIDAMQKAEMANAKAPPMPECKILEPIQDVTVGKMKKSRHNKDIGIENEILKPSILKHNFHDDEEQSVISCDWSPVVQSVHLDDVIEEKRINESFENQTVIQKHANENEIIGSKSTACTDKKFSKKRSKKLYANLNPTNFIQNEFDGDTAHVELNDIKGNLDETLVSSAKNLASEASYSFCANSSTVRCAEKEKKTEDDENIEVNSSAIDNNLSTDNLDIKTKCQEKLTLEQTSSNNDPNANVVPMDTEEDGGVRNVEKHNSITASPSWSTVGKKNNRSKKKKRR